MLQPRLYRGSASAETSITSLAAAWSALSLCSHHAQSTSVGSIYPHTRSTSATTTFVRHATHQAQGRANGPKDSAGRRLGAKKSASEYVIPGNIIFKQRGTKWFPGENVGIGKDHTIYAKISGYVRYYRDPAVHPKRRYIGVALEREGPGSKLPSPANAPTRRRLGMYAVPIKSPGLRSDQDARQFLEAHISQNSAGTVAGGLQDDTNPPMPSDKIKLTQSLPTSTPPQLRPGLSYRETNYEIGKAAEKKGIKAREYDRGDRWLAWRKRSRRVKAAMLAKAAKQSRKSKGKKSNKGTVGAAGRVAAKKK